jgi:putative spermidine/putrescine transport system substrate-binding protein
MRASGGGGGGKIDLVSASGDVSLRLIRARDVAPVNVGLIPDWKDFLPALKSPPFNTLDGVHYGIALQWAPNTLLYNTRRVTPAPRSWSALYNTRYRGKVTVPNNPIQIADAALYLMTKKPGLGIRDPYELTRPQFDAAVALLRKQRPLVGRYWNYATDEIRDFRDGRALVGSAWPYQALVLEASNVPVSEILPREGATGWADSWMLARKAPHRNCAYLWIRYVSTPRVQARQAIVFGTTPVNPKACPFMNRLRAGSCARFHLDEPPSYSRSIHFWKTPVRQCGWGGRIDCVDYTEWQPAWTRITG